MFVFGFLREGMFISPIGNLRLDASRLGPSAGMRAAATASGSRGSFPWGMRPPGAVNATSMSPFRFTSLRSAVLFIGRETIEGTRETYSEYFMAPSAGDRHFRVFRVPASVFQAPVGGDGKPLADVLRGERAPMDALHRRPEAACPNA